MDLSRFYSIRMRATAENQHVSGAERICASDKIQTTVQSLIDREKNAEPERVVITIERLGRVPIRTLAALDVLTVNTPDTAAGRAAASRLLQSLDVSHHAVMTAIDHLRNGASSSGHAMRGAMIIDALTGERLEPDHERGVRASRFDWTDEAFDAISRKLAEIGLTHFRTREALALATKVAHAPGMIAELCWSDDPDYTAGYVASLMTGYVRFPILKAQGDPRGGRAFFVARNNLDIGTFINYLQAEAVLIADSGECRPGIEPDDYFKEHRLCD